MAQQTSLDQETAFVIHSGSPDNNGLYTLQRGEFEFRVASGDLEYVPALEMTIITSYPKVEFVYTGTPNYVPPKKEPDSPALNITIYKNRPPEAYTSMKIDTKYYGEIDYTKDELVVFPDGLFGFSQYHDYLPLSMEEDDSSLLILAVCRRTLCSLFSHRCSSTLSFLFTGSSTRRIILSGSKFQ